MVIRTLLLLALLFSASVPAASQLSAAVDKNPALLNEPITLEISLDAKVDAAAIDFNVLKSDFTVMMPSVSQSIRNINGNTSQSTLWKVVLVAKAAGDFTIPSFSYQNLTTEPINLTILAADSQENSSNTENKELFLQSEIEQSQLYVQQLSYYTLTIYSKEEFQNASLTEPTLEGAIIQKVGQDIEGSELVNGIRYRTFSRRYAITPQKSGHFSIAPPVFSGEMIDRASRQYGYYSRTKRVLEQAQTIAIEVQPIPDSFPSQTANWLVAGLVTLTEEWSPNITELTVGEPITRTITLSAVDVAENQLPELTLSFPNSLRLYQEQPQAKSAERNGHIIAQKVFTTAVIATESGEVSLPEVSLPWWNSKTNQLESAVLPAKTFTVSPAANSQSTNSIPAASQDNIASTTLPITSTKQSAGVNNWAWTYSTSVILLIWVVTLLLFYMLWQYQQPASPAPSTTAVAKFNSQALKAACLNNIPKTAKKELLRWGYRQFNQQFTSLSQLTEQLNSAALVAEINQLNAALYANNVDSWQGQGLWQQWQLFKPDITKTNNSADLAPLYPNNT